MKSRAREETEFARRLAETVAWCVDRADVSDPKWSLRSEELRPESDYDPPDDPTLWNSPEIITSVADRRRKLGGTQQPTERGLLHGGRLLLCYFDETNHNEASAVESRWFFDGNDNPPWDTWVCCVDDALVSWVPPQFVSLASEGMAVECCGMLMWLPARSVPGWLVKYAG